MNYLNMKKLVVKGIIPKNLPCLVNDFEEEFNQYLRTAKKNWRTIEGFSLDFDSALEDLRNSHFLYVDDSKLELLIKKRLKVIEEI